MQGFDCATYGEVFPVKITSPTCKDLGIPRESDDVIVSARLIKNPSLHLDGIRYEALVKNSMSPSDPFSPLCMIPLPSPFTLEHLEPTFIRKRNERERDRVRCVNDGYARLKEQLPLENKHKRISKVEILRRAIDYIKYLNAILETDNENDSNEHTHEQGVDESRDTELAQQDNVNEDFPENDTLSICCKDLSPEQNTTYFTLDTLSDSDEIYGQGSDLGYESFTSGCEMEDDHAGSCDFDYSECSRGLKRPLEGVSVEDCSPCKQ
ncbi:achaete-scute homolog 2-like [Saccostrea echinata]|uniref:achaete-scute homolog 2-like n=1 Tax=Saccostrea echinata TaxID=191078 RepID=UPI002A82734C|nr:achaete-scute homolog 2-like [Saccostrea echinata]